jgi:hypothetical protein
MTVSVARFIGSIVLGVAVMGTSAEAQVLPGRYATNGVTVHDGKTNLTWQQTAPAGTFTWVLARSYCAGAGTSLGGTGWRLPTLKELLTIVDDSRSGPSIDTTAFGATSMSSPFWSSSPVSGPPGYAWTVDFDAGNSASSAVSETVSVRCVR